LSCSGGHFGFLIHTKKTLKATRKWLFMYCLSPFCISDQNYIINFPPPGLTLDFAPLWWPSWDV
jgi:hypothetical protein